MIFPASPGIMLIFLGLWFTSVDWGSNQMLARAVVIAGNAAFYGGVSYALLRLILRRKK